MIRSKATAALMRLKEMDRKYNIKCNESKRGQCNASTESSIEDTPKNLRFDSKVSDYEKRRTVESFTAADAGDKARSKSSPKSKIEVRMPSLVGKGDDVPNGRAGSGSKKSSPDSSTIGIETSLADEDTDVWLKEKNVSTGKKSPRAVSNLNSTSKEYNFHGKDKVEVRTPESASLPKNESSVATILSETLASSGVQSVIVSEAIESVDVDSMTRRSDRKTNTSEQRSKVQNSIKKSNIGDDKSTVDQVHRGTSDERSEIISELSKATNEDGDFSKESSRQEQKEYESDTFEEVFSSTVSLSSMEDQPRKASTGKAVQDTIRSGVKQIMITAHKQTESARKAVTDDSLEDASSRAKEIIELVPPKIIQNTSECDIELDEELSNYVKTTEHVDEVTPITLLKTSKQATSARKQPRRTNNKKHRKSSNENTEESESPMVSVRESLTEHKEKKNEDNALREKSFSTIGKVAKRTNEKEESETPVNRSFDKPSDIETIDTAKGTSENDVRNVGSNTVSILLRETPKTSDVTCTLRELNRDAIDAIIRRHRTVRASRNARDKWRNCEKCGTIVRLPLAAHETVEKDEADESATGSLENLKESSRDQRSNNKRHKAKRAAKSSKARKPSSRGKVEEKHSRFDCRQSRRLRKQAAALRLQQEREDIRNYLLELERTRLEFGPGDANASSKLTPFKPLEFPKIEAFVKPELADVSLKSQFEVSELQERISTIKQWLKDRYVLYRDYSSLAQTANAKYIPASLEDAKKTIRQLQKATIETR